MGKAAGVVDFIVIHSYPLWGMDFGDYADGKIDFQVCLVPKSSRAMTSVYHVAHVHMQAMACRPSLLRLSPGERETRYGTNVHACVSSAHMLNETWLHMQVEQVETHSCIPPVAEMLVQPQHGFLLQQP